MVSHPSDVCRMTSSDRDWYREIDLDPDSPHPAMGTRNLGDRPWLVVDDLFQAELDYKAYLLAEHHDEVFAALDSADEASAEVLDLVGGSAGSPGDLHPLDQAGRMVQEDLCLMEPTDEGWILSAASLCFPSMWRLTEKLGHPMAVIHRPVPGYAEVLDRRVTNLFNSMLNRVDERVVWRRNWFMRPEWELFSPVRPDPVVVPAERCVAELYLRSERQTLRRLPRSGWILFTIRTQHAPVSDFVADDEILARFTRFVADAGVDRAEAHSIHPAQLAELRQALLA